MASGYESAVHFVPLGAIWAVYAHLGASAHVARPAIGGVVISLALADARTDGLPSGR